MFLRRLLYPIVCAPATDEGALAAITAAIENPGGAPASSTTETDSGGDQGGTGEEAAGGEGGETGSEERGAPPGGAATGESAASEQAGGEGTDGGKGGKKGAAAEETATPDPEADRGDGRNAAGRFVKKADETDEQLAARRSADPLDGKKPGAKPDAGAGGKKADHVNDPIPDEIKGRTRERIEGLVATAKDLNTKLEQQTAELESGRELFGMIEATGADAATFARHMDVLSLMCSDELADKQKAVELLRKAADTLGQQLGEPPPGKDPLEGHQDLIDEVEAGETKRERAIEIAKFRNQTAAAERHRTATETRNNEQTAAEQQRAKVKTALNELSTELHKKDGKEVYERKHKLLVPFIKRLNAALPPDKIVAAVREAYNALELAPAAAPAANGTRAPAGSGQRQPARATQGAGGGGSKVPSNPLEALEFGLEEHARATGAR